MSYGTRHLAKHLYPPRFPHLPASDFCPVPILLNLFRSELVRVQNKFPVVMALPTDARSEGRSGLNGAAEA
jgi:hypothetical protein